MTTKRRGRRPTRRPKPQKRRRPPAALKKSDNPPVNVHELKPRPFAGASRYKNLDPTRTFIASMAVNLIRGYSLKDSTTIAACDLAYALGREFVPPPAPGSSDGKDAEVIDLAEARAAREGKK